MQLILPEKKSVLLSEDNGSETKKSEEKKDDDGEKKSYHGSTSAREKKDEEKKNEEKKECNTNTVSVRGPPAIDLSATEGDCDEVFVPLTLSLDEDDDVSFRD